MTLTATRPPTKLGAQFAWVSLGRGVAAVAQAAAMVLVIRHSSPAEFGFFASVYGAVIVPQTVAGLGLQTFITRERAHDPRSGLVRAALRLNDIAAAGLAVTLTAFAVVAGLTLDHRFLLLLPLAIWAAAEMNADVHLGVMIADGLSHVSTFNLVGRRVAAVGLLALLLERTEVDPMLSFGVATAVAALGSAFVTHRLVGRRAADCEAGTVQALLPRCVPYWINSVATQARNLDTAVTSLVAGPVQASFYGAAARLTNPLRILPQSLAVVLLPASVNSDAADRHRVLKFVGLAVGLMAVPYLILVLVLPWGVPVLLGEDYRGAVPTLQLTCGGLVFASAAALLTSTLQGAGESRYVAGVAVVTTTVCVAAVAAGGHVWGAPGAAAGLGLSFAVQSGCLLARYWVIAAPSRRGPDLHGQRRVDGS